MNLKIYGNFTIVFRFSNVNIVLNKNDYYLFLFKTKDK